jgi:hypothetical protein
MRNDTRKVKPIFVDLETKSSCPIEYGITRYFADKDADWLICSVVDTLGEATTQTNYTGGKEISPKVLNHKGLFVAHNWFFEWSFFNKFYPGTWAADFRNWMCTAAMARWFGICAPRAKLEEVAEAFGLEKMPEGKGLIAKYSIPRKDGLFNICEKGSEDALLFEKYCAKDADLSRIIYEKFDAHGGFNVEEFRAAQAIDVRGVPVDVKAAQFLVNRKDKDKKNAFQMAEKIAGHTAGGALVLSASGAFVEYMKDKFDIVLPDARAGTLDAIDYSDHPKVTEIENVLYVRKLLTARAGDKAQLILDRAHNDRIRSATVFHAAGTGRFQSWGVNFFNFSRLSVKSWEKEKNTAPVPALQRGVVCAPKGKTITESDWRGIENYLSLYYAGDTEQLHRIEAGESPYLIFAEKLYGEKITKEDKRYVPAKSAVLGCGYGAGFTKLSIIYRLDLEVANQLHAGWRKVNPKIVAMWYAFHDAMVRAAVYREIARERGFTFSPLGNDNDVKITLQDGHDLYYRGLEVHYDEKNRVQIMRDGQALHGGLITENLMQATCARLLYRALVRCEKEGLEVFLHIYDSIVIESYVKNAKKDAVLLEKIMCDAPPWAGDLKLRVDQHTGKRWTK